MIIGVTNIIPFFGPFIGAIPSFLIVVLQNPLQGVYFLIFIFILQQIDGNIIGPKILGDSTGLSSFWVVFAILVFGGLWGFPGMLLGVPLMAVIYYVAQKLVSYFLRKRGLVDDTGSYIHLMRIDKRTNELVYEEKRRKAPGKKSKNHLKNNMLPSYRTMKYKSPIWGIFMSGKSRIIPIKRQAAHHCVTAFSDEYF